MSNLTIRYIDPRLDDGWRESLRRHLMRLDRASLRQRFMSPADAATIERYTAATRPELVVFLEDRSREAGDRVVACAEVHAVPGESHHEVSVSVEPVHQSQGHGKTVVHAAAEACQRRGIRELRVYCDQENTRMQKIARSFRSRSLPIAHWAMAAFSVKLPAAV